MTDRALRAWRGDDRERAAAVAGVSGKVLRTYERDPERVRSREDRRRLRRYYDALRVLYATEQALLAAWRDAA